MPTTAKQPALPRWPSGTGYHGAEQVHAKDDPFRSAGVLAGASALATYRVCGEAAGSASRLLVALLV
jgi:hypothetical protein